MNISTKQGSQHWLQVAVNQAPEVLLNALRPALGLPSDATITWSSPLKSEDFCEYRDMEALRKMGIKRLPIRDLDEFWPQRGPVWDALGRTSDGQFVFVEAKAHAGEVKSPATGATSESLALIQKSLEEARNHFAPGSDADWSGTFYQYANRLAHHYLFHTVNGLRSHMVFLYFLNASDMNGPKTEAQWSGAIAELHGALGLTQTERQGVHEVFLDVALLQSSIKGQITV